MEYDRETIKANRQTWVDFLKDKSLKKAIGHLSNKESGGRCCLGHGCVALGMEEKFNVNGRGVFGLEAQTARAPQEFVDMVGLYDDIGITQPAGIKIEGVGVFSSLISLNDSSNATPQQIGEYLETVIEGGANTPFIALSDYD